MKQQQQQSETNDGSKLPQIFIKQSSFLLLLLLNYSLLCLRIIILFQLNYLAP